MKIFQVFFDPKFSDVHISHHAFAFPKTTNYPEIVNSVETLLEMLKTGSTGKIWLKIGRKSAKNWL